MKVGNKKPGSAAHLMIAFTIYCSGCHRSPVYQNKLNPQPAGQA
jgi:hypothetical protein